MPKKRKPEPWEVTKEDIEREVQRMRDNASKYPSLRLIVDKYPEGYDPDRQPETKSQIKLKRRVDKVTSDPRGQIYVVDVPTGVGADLHMIDGSLILDMPAVNPAQVGFARFVDKCSGIPDASERKVRGEQSGGTPVYNPYGAVWFYPRLENDFGLRDGLAHDLAYKEIVRNTGGEQFYWLLRGFAYQVSTQMNGSIHSKFFATKSTGVIDTGGAEALPGFGDSPAGWRLMVGMELAAGTALTLTDLCKGRPQDYTNREMAAAYCLTDYLLHEKKEKLAAFLDSAYKEFIARYKEKKNPEDALELMNRLLESLEMNEQEFMDAFRIWALANYFDLNSAEEGK